MAIYIGIPAVTLYAVGFVSLWIQLQLVDSFPYTDRQIAWFAASLVDRTVVIGTGLHVIFMSIVFSSLAAGASFLIFAFIGLRRRRRQHIASGSWSVVWRAMVLLIGLSGALFVTGNARLPSRLKATGFPSPDNGVDMLKMFCLLGAFALFLVGGFLIGYLVWRSQRPSYMIALAYLAFVFAALLLATTEWPSLPVVKLNDTVVMDQLDYYYFRDYYRHTDRVYTVLASREELWYLYSPGSGVVAVPINKVPTTTFYSVDEFHP